MIERWPIVGFNDLGQNVSTTKVGASTRAHLRRVYSAFNNNHTHNYT